MTADKSVPVCSPVSFTNLYNLSSRCTVTGLFSLPSIGSSLTIQLELFELADNGYGKAANQEQTHPTELQLGELCQRL